LILNAQNSLALAKLRAATLLLQSSRSVHLDRNDEI